MRGPTTAFTHRGLSPHQFTPMSGAHHPATGNAASPFWLTIERKNEDRSHRRSASSPGAAIFVASPRPPRHDGKTLSEWLVMLNPHVDRAADHEKASAAIRAMGAAALPQLRQILRSRPNSLNQRIRDYAARWRLVRAPKLYFQEQEFRAARAAYHLAEEADVNIASLVPDLQFHLTNSNYADTEMARALARAGPEGISCLTNLVATGERRVRDRAGWALALDRSVRSQPGAQDALIRSASSDPDRRIRANAVLYLSSFREDGAANGLVPLGIQFLKSEDGYERWVGAKLLAAHVSVQEAQTSLKAALNDSDDRVRSTAVRALQIVDQLEP
jgi:HEAT repeat protein